MNTPTPAQVGEAIAASAPVALMLMAMISPLFPKVPSEEAMRKGYLNLCTLCVTLITAGCFLYFPAFYALLLAAAPAALGARGLHNVKDAGRDALAARKVAKRKLPAKPHTSAPPDATDTPIPLSDTAPDIIFAPRGADAPWKGGVFEATPKNAEPLTSPTAPDPAVADNVSVDRP